MFSYDCFTCCLLYVVSYMISFRCYQSHAVMWGTVSYMLSWMLTVTCCQVGNCQLHVVMWALSVTCCHGCRQSHVVMDAVSHLLTSTCYQQMLSLMLAVNYFVMLMLSVKCCQILAAKRHITFSSRCHHCMDADRHMLSNGCLLSLHIYSHMLSFGCCKSHVVNCVLSVTCCLPHIAISEMTLWFDHFAIYF
jgi:hypothetical protein